MDTTAQRPIVVGSDGKLIPGVRYQEWRANGAVFLLVVFPLTEEERLSVQRWLKQAGYSSFANWENYNRIMARALGCTGG
ncbi:MAG: hypothetical protein AB1806_15270 [Acidobacteriota bacterium]